MTYNDGHSVEKGIVKSIYSDRVYVVYGLEDWTNYQDYTAQLTPEKFLTAGW